MRVLGVDPGLSRCGVGIVEGTGRRPSPVSAGVITTPTDQPVSKRLLQLHRELAELIARTRPDAVAVERVFFSTNVRTAMSVGQAAGIALLAAEQAGIDVTEYTPTQVKAAVAGSGTADKEQLGFMVRTQLRLVEVPSPADAADALALALCHLHAGVALAADGGMSPRLAAALAAASPGAQILRGRR